MVGYKAAYAAKEMENGKLKCAECIISLEILGEILMDLEAMQSHKKEVRQFAEKNLFRTDRVRVIGIHDKSGNLVKDQCIMTIPLRLEFFAGIVPAELFRYAVGEEICIPSATPTNKEGIYFFKKMELAQKYLIQIDVFNEYGKVFAEIMNSDNDSIEKSQLLLSIKIPDFTLREKQVECVLKNYMIKHNRWKWGFSQS